MPELPEVESARRVIERSALGRTIADVDDSDTYECRPHRPGEIRDALVGHRLTSIHRRGKAMWCELGGDTPRLGIHLGMSGRVMVTGSRDSEGPDGDDGTDGNDGADEGGDRQRTDDRPEQWIRFTMTFEDGGTLRLLDQRRLGRVRLDPDIDALGPDAGEIGRADFRDRVGRGTAPIKARLLDQATVAGIGNLLADEVLWQSGVDPRRESRSLSTEELDRMRRELRQAVRRAIRGGGVHTGEIVAHRRTGEHCPRCGAELRRATVGGRTTWWCPQEQT